MALMSGRILMEDGSRVPDALGFREAILAPVGNPNAKASTVMRISTDGSFSRMIKGGDFRFYLRMLPEGYEIRSMRFGAVDLMKESLVVSGKEAINIEVRVAKKTTPAATGRVSGKVLDVATGTPANATRVTLCCTSSAPAERYSAAVLADGSFELSGIPAGRYTPTVEFPTGVTPTYTLNRLVEVGAQDTTVDIYTRR
jgi:hypothetical protein